MNVIASMITSRFDRWRDNMQNVLDRSGNYINVDDVYKQCVECRKLFFDNDDGYAVINVQEWPRETYLHVMLAGGSLEGFDKLDPVITRFGQQIGATKATMIGRKGFARTLSSRGWTSPFIYMEKEIP